MVVANAVNMAQRFLMAKLANAALVVDATAGNGKDTLFLAENTPDTATVIAFDIQQQALLNTEQLLTQSRLSHKVRLILASHAKMADYIQQPIDAAIFNLGYLPGGDHTVNTCPDTTIEAIRQTLQLLTPGGMVTVAAYPGYEHGKEECHVLHQYLTGLSQKLFAVACWSMVNQINNPPVLYVIEKRGE